MGQRGSLNTSPTASSKIESQGQSVEVIPKYHTRRNAHLFEFAASNVLEEGTRDTRRMTKFETSPRDTDGHEDHPMLFEVEGEGEALFGGSAAETGAGKSPKAFGTTSIQSFDQLFEALSMTFAGLKTVGVEVKTLAEQVRIL